MHTVQFLMSGLAAQFPQGTFGKFASEPKTLGVWALAFSQKKITQADARNFLRWVAEHGTSYGDLSLGFVINTIRGDAEQRAQRAIMDSNKAALKALPKPTSREKAQAHIAALRRALSGAGEPVVKSGG